jgi:hypothetical protein
VSCLGHSDRAGPAGVGYRPIEGTFPLAAGFADGAFATEGEEKTPIAEAPMGGLIYLIGLIVVIMFILSFLGLR